MELLTEIHQADFPARFNEFEQCVGAAAWKRTVQKVSAEIKGARFLGGYLRHLHRFAFALWRISEFRHKFGHLGFPVGGDVEIYEACVLVTQFSDIRRHVTKAEGLALARRIAGGLKNPNDLRALQFELQLATHFAKRGYDIAFPESRGEGTFDILATRAGKQVEIECKSVSGNKGRQVHRRAALEIHHLIKREFSPLLKTLNTGLLLRIVFDKRAPNAYSDHVQLVNAVKSVVLSGKTRAFSGYEIRLCDFKLAGTPFENGRHEEGAVHEFLRSHGIVNRETIILGRRGINVIAVSLESRVSDRLLAETFDVVSDAAKRQLTGQRAGIVCVKFEELTADQIGELGVERGDPTALRIRASKFLSSASAKNVSVLSFFADGELTTMANGGISRGGRTYSFANDANSFAADIDEQRVFV